MSELTKLLEKVAKLNEKKKWQEVIDLLPEEVLEKHKNADLYAEKSQAYYRLKEHELSHQSAIASLNIDSKNVKGLYYKGNFFSKKKDYEKAKEYYKKAIELDAEYVHAYNGLGNAYAELKDYEKAEGYYLKAIGLDAKYVHSYNNLGVVYDDLKDYEKAKEYFSKAIELDEQYVRAYLNLGILYEDLKDFGKAKEYYLKVIKIDKQYADAYNNLGSLYYNLKDYEKAKEYYLKAIEVDKEYNAAYYNLGLLYETLKDYQGAIKAFKQYVELEKSNKPDLFFNSAVSKIENLENIINNSDYKIINNFILDILEFLLFKGNYVTHYTSLSASEYLVLKNSNFRLSEASFLNDTSEGKELFEFLSYNIDSKQGDEIKLYKFIPKPFIGSFVPDKKYDDLTLWRMYGKENNEEAKGSALTLKVNDFIKNINETLSSDEKERRSLSKTLELKFYNVAYRDLEKEWFVIPSQPDKEVGLNEKMNDLKMALDKINSKPNIPEFVREKIDESLNKIAYLFKSFEYIYEHELRLILDGGVFKKVIDSSYNPPRVYIELAPIRNAIKSITLGPKVERPEEWKAAFYYSLKNDKLEPSILISSLPFK